MRVRAVSVGMLVGLGMLVSCSVDPGDHAPRGQHVHAVTEAVGWHTHGTKIYPPTAAHAVGAPLASDETSFRIEGVSWYGFETRDMVVHGLWGNDVAGVVGLVASGGFNTLRIPFSNAMWQSTAAVSASKLSGCPSCAGKTPRQILAMIIAEAHARGLKVILDNHRSTAGNSAESNGLWYTPEFPEQRWLQHWQELQAWVRSSPWADAVVAYELRNEPHTVGKGRTTGYLQGSTWGSGDGLTDPNPDPFAPACVTTSSCHDWRLAAQRAGTLLLGQADQNGWPLPLVIVSGIGNYPISGSVPADNTTESTWWGGMLKGVRGNATNPGAPIVLNLGRSPTGVLGAPIDGQLVYTAHDYGPALFQQTWFNTSTCYASECSGTSLVDQWYDTWGFVTDSIEPEPAGSYVWDNTGVHPEYRGYSAAPLLLGEFGTGDAPADVSSTTAGSQGQWFSSLVELIRDSSDDSSDATGLTARGAAIRDLSWAYWALNGNDDYGLTDSGFTAVDTPAKLAALCSIQAAGCAACGDGTCSIAETCSSCATDCGACPPPPDGCGNGTCDAGENCNTCTDCSGVNAGKPSVRYCCGDGTASPAEGNGAICNGNF